MSTIRHELESLADEDRAILMGRYFQTAPGQYAAGDQFWGISNGPVRVIARRWAHLPREEVEVLLRDPVHECRFAALLIWVRQYARASPGVRQAIYQSYIHHLDYINNWDLVDLSARDIVGYHLYDKDRSPLYDLARTEHLWANRVALIATFYFIHKADYTDTFALVKVLLFHRHHLIHKAMGWVLREIGKRNLTLMEEFLHEHIHELPRTTLRYAIERLPTARRQYYLTL
jgi:3-methyladenine DNA glycosylase AlkD